MFYASFTTDPFYYYLEVINHIKIVIIIISITMTLYLSTFFEKYALNE